MAFIVTVPRMPGCTSTFSFASRASAKSSSSAFTFRTTTLKVSALEIGFGGFGCAAAGGKASGGGTFGLTGALSAPRCPSAGGGVRGAAQALSNTGANTGASNKEIDFIAVTRRSIAPPLVKTRTLLPSHQGL
ncbi:MAG: hypothetical protein LBE33_02045 [Zoogloeaceae bacterium]|nr:hypothetical protein [Zoogloeaceae bacterium]